MQSLFDDLWANQDVISVNNVMDITLPVGCLFDQVQVIVPYSGLYRLHSSLLELQVRQSFFSSFSDITNPFLGFGRSVSWKEEGAIIPPGHRMTYKDALHVITNDFILKLMVPGWALGLTPRLRKVKLGFEELHVRR